MKDNHEKIFLTEQEAKRAVQLDFQQYGPQRRLFQELAPLILGQTVIPLEGSGHDDVWIKQSKPNHMQRLTPDELGELLCRELTANSYPLPLLAGICSRTFQAKTHTGINPATSTWGIWVESDMDKFHCAQCGQCCQNLNFENECTHEDYRRWQTLGLDHIMERVLVLDAGIEPAGYKIWVEPGTHELSTICPWLAPARKKKGFTCIIQDVKPEICRQYPLTRKHARMTGCRGSFKTTLQNSALEN